MAEADALTFEASEVDSPADRAGQKLRAARERAGLDRAALATRTKINERHLEALESGDFAALPARIYAVGFARTYAGAVGLDGPTIAAQVHGELAEQDNPLAARPSHQLEIGDPAKVPSSRLAWLAGALGLAVVAAGAVFWRSWFMPAVELPPVTQTAEIASPASAIAPTAEARLPGAGEMAAAEAAGLVLTPIPTTAQPAPARSAPRTMAPRASAGIAPPPPQSTPSPVPAELEPLTVEPPPPPAGE